MAWLKHSCRRRMKTNVGALEQVLSIGIGTGLVVYGLSQRDKRGMIPVLVGGGILLHGLSSYSPLYDAIGLDETSGSPVRHPLNRVVHFRESINVNRSPSDLYSFWRDLQNLPRFMSSIIAVEVLDDTCSRWHARGPFNKEFHWEAEIVEERNDEIIGWRTIERESNLEHTGTVSFQRAPGNRGTIVTLDCRWSPPGGVFGALTAKLLPQDPARQVTEDLRRFRQLMETGEISRNHKPSSDQPTSGIAQTVRGLTDELGITDPVSTEQRS
jgi:uncharacterized membrane protein